MISDMFLLATAADVPVAIAASEIEAVMRLGDIVPVARTAPHVRGLAALRSRVLTVIDVTARVTGHAGPLPASPIAVVAMIDGHGYGFVIDDVDDITTPDEPPGPVQGRIGGGWSPYVRGTVIHGHRSHLLISVRDLALASSPLMSSAA